MELGRRQSREGAGKENNVECLIFPRENRKEGQKLSRSGRKKKVKENGGYLQPRKWTGENRRTYDGSFRHGVRKRQNWTF